MYVATQTHVQEQPCEELTSLESLPERRFEDKVLYVLLRIL